MPDDVNRDEVTRFLRNLAGGDEQRAGEFMPRLYAELRAIAQGCIGNAAAAHTLHPTALVNEAYLKLFGRDGLAIHDRKHFYRLAAKAMRQLLVGHARARHAAKRGGAEHPQSLDEAVAAAGGIDVDYLDLDRALTQLAEIDGRQAQVVELRYFVGMEVAEVADVLGVSRSTVEGEWRAARAWLGRRLRDGGPT